MTKYSVVVNTRTDRIVHKEIIGDFDEAVALDRWRSKYAKPRYHIALTEEYPSKEERSWMVVKQIGEILYKKRFSPEQWSWVQSNYPTPTYNVQIVEEPLSEEKSTYLLITDTSIDKAVERFEISNWTIDGRYKLTKLEKRYPSPLFQVKILDTDVIGERTYYVAIEMKTGEIIDRVDVTNSHPRVAGDELSYFTSKYREPHYVVDTIMDIQSV